MRIIKNIAIAIMIIGLVTVIVGLIINKDDLSEIFIDNEKYEVLQTTGNKAIKNVKIDTLIHNVEFFSSEDEFYKVEYHTSERDVFSINVENETLIITSSRKRKFFNFSWGRIESPKITVWLPLDFNGKINTKTATGSVDIDDFNLESLDINLSTGRVNLNNLVVTNHIKINTSTSAIALENIESNNLNVESSTGKITVSDAKIKGNATLNTSTGSIILTNLDTSYLKASASTGNIAITVTQVKENYLVDLSTSTGSIYYFGIKLGKELKTDSGNKYIIAATSTGNITIDNK